MTTFSELLEEHGLNSIEHVSNEPWSNYKESDYTVEQWHNACLIHQHDGPPTKASCKLPVKTPNGILNKNGVIAASAALAGARGGVDASPDEKTKAKNALIRYYNQLNMPVPESLKHSAVEDFISHFGVRGMRWGIRRDELGNLGIRRSKPTKEPASEEAAKATVLKSRVKTSGTQALSNTELQAAIKRMQLETDYTRLSATTSSKGRRWATNFILGVGQQQAREQTNKYVTGQVAKALAKSAAKKAATAAAIAII